MMALNLDTLQVACYFGSGNTPITILLLFILNKMSNKYQESVAKLTETHRANMRRSLEHRLKVAREQGDQDLVRALEAEYKKITT